MRKIIFTSIISIIFFIGCNDKLNLEPIGSLSESSYYKTATDAKAALTACYNTLLRISSQGGWAVSGWELYGDIMSSDVESHADIVDYVQIQESTLLPNNSTITTQWQLGYVGIYRANVALDKLPEIEMDDALKSRLIGEAKFIRAWWYFRMVKLFGNIPLVTKPLNPDELYVTQSPKQEIYNQIEKDLTDAEQILPISYSSEDVGRATKGAAKVYLAELYMIQKQWVKAKTKLEDIMGFGIYGLMDSYTDLFTQAGDNSKEGIFEIQYTANTGLDLGNFGTVMFAPNGEGLTPNGGWGWTRPTQDIVDEFEKSPKEDPRLSASIFRKGDVFEGKVFDDKVHGTGFGHRKYCISAAMGSEVTWPFQTSVNLILYRYAEVFLMYAEVLNELGEPSKAVEYINKVRTRPSVDMPVLPTTLSKDQVFEAIRHERRVELCFEGKTGYDLRRWGIAAKFLKSPDRWQNNIVLNPQYGGNYFKFTEGKDELLPIPQVEIDRSKGSLIQNPGFSK